MLAFCSNGKKKSIGEKQNDDKAMKKKNKFHGIFLALLLKKNCFVYEFAIHKTFFFSSFGFRLLYWKIMYFVKENQAQSSKIYIVFCSFSPAFVLIQQYSGTNAEFTKADTVIFRTDIYNLTSGRKEFNFKRTLKYDSKWLDSKYLSIPMNIFNLVQSKINL